MIISSLPTIVPDPSGPAKWLLPVIVPTGRPITIWFQKREQTTEPETDVSKMGESKFAKPRPSATWSTVAAIYVV